MSWCFVTQTVFSLDLDGTCIATLHEMATFVLETPHQNTECQLQGCHDSSLTNFTPPPKCIRRKRKKKGVEYFKKKSSRRGTPSCNLPKGSFLYRIFFKSNIKFSSANLLLTKKKRGKQNLT